MMNNEMQGRNSEGRNVKRFREMMGMKQDALAYELGGEWTQKKISQLEQRDTLEPEVLEQIARALKVSPEAIRNFNEEAAISIISNTFQEHRESLPAAPVNQAVSFSPMDKIVELYERLLASEREKIALLKAQQKDNDSDE
jgi:transcriptional regulator with XRE-family HTH domain